MSDKQFNAIMQILARLSDRVEMLSDSQTKTELEIRAGFAEVAEIKATVKTVVVEQTKMKAEIKAGFVEQANIKVRIEAGFAEQTTLSQLVLDTVGESFQELEQEYIQTKHKSDKRLSKLEKHIFKVKPSSLENA